MYSFSKSHVSVSIANQSFYRFITVIKHPRDGNVPPTHFLVHPPHGVINIATFALLNLNHQKIGMSNTNTSSLAPGPLFYGNRKNKFKCRVYTCPLSVEKASKTPPRSDRPPLSLQGSTHWHKSQAIYQEQEAFCGQAMMWLHCPFVLLRGKQSHESLLSECPGKSSECHIALCYLQTYVSLNGTHF